MSFPSAYFWLLQILLSLLLNNSQGRSFTSAIRRNAQTQSLIFGLCCAEPGIGLDDACESLSAYDILWLMQRYIHIHTHTWCTYGISELSKQGCSSFKSPSLVTNLSFPSRRSLPFLHTDAEELQKRFSLGNVLMSAVHITDWFLAGDLSKSIKPH